MRLVYTWVTIFISPLDDISNTKKIEAVINDGRFVDKMTKVE
jgi:hypothetical protein